MSTITTTSTSAVSLAPLQMHLPSNPSADPTQGALSAPMTSPDALGYALLAAEERLQVADDRMLKALLDLAFNMGQRVHALDGEKARLQGEISLQQRRIEVLEVLHQEKWTAHQEAARVRMRAISGEISKIIQSIETFQAKYLKCYQSKDSDSFDDLEVREKMLKSLGPDNYFRTKGVLFIQGASLYLLKDWLKITDKLPFDKNLEKYPKTPIQTGKAIATQEDYFYGYVPYIRGLLKITDRTLENPPESAIPTQIVRAVAGSQALAPAESFPEIAPYAQNRLALETEIAGMKQELSVLEQTRESKEKDHRVFITTLNHKVCPVFLRSWTTAHSIQRVVGGYIERSSKLIRTFEEMHLMDGECMTSEKASLEEGVRLKGMISATLPHIQEALEWANKEVEQ